MGKPVEDENMDFKSLVMERYNAKKFDGRKVPEEKLNELCDIIRYAISANNLQPWKIKIIAEQKLKDLLVPATMLFNQERVATCSHLLVFCADTDLESHWTKLEAQAKKIGLPKPEMYQMAQVAKVILGRTPEERKIRAQWDVFLAVGNAVNGAKALGMDSSPMGGFNAKEYARILELPSNLVPTMLVAVGYAADKPLPKLRFPIGDVFF